MRSKVIRAKKILSKRSKFGKNQTHEALILKTRAHIYCSIMCLSTKKVLLTVSTVSKEFMENKAPRMKMASLVGSLLADRCMALSINPVFNTAQYKFHGIVESLVTAFKEKMNNV